MAKKLLDPKCLGKEQKQFALTNRGELIPCCWCDTQINREDKNYQSLLEVSKIEDYDSIDEILLTEPWLIFYDHLKKGRGFSVCYDFCAKR